MSIPQVIRTRKTPRTPTFKVNPSLAAKLKVLDEYVDLTSEDTRKVSHLIAETRDHGRKGQIFEVLLQYRRGPVTRATIAEKLEIPAKQPGELPRLYPHDIQQLDQLVADKLVHEWRRVTPNGKGSQVVYQVASPVAQVEEDRIRRDRESAHHQQILKKNKAEQEEKERVDAERRAKWAEAAEAERVAKAKAKAAATPKWDHRLDQPPAKMFELPAFTGNQKIILGVVAICMLAAFVTLAYVLVTRA